jgi:hypothetical protein
VQDLVVRVLCLYVGPLSPNARLLICWFPEGELVYLFVFELPLGLRASYAYLLYSDIDDLNRVTMDVIVPLNAFKGETGDTPVVLVDEERARDLVG